MNIWFSLTKWTISSRLLVLPSLICLPALFLLDLSTNWNNLSPFPARCQSSPPIMMSFVPFLNWDNLRERGNENQRVKVQSTNSHEPPCTSLLLLCASFHLFVLLVTLKNVCVDPCACLLACSHVFHSISLRDHKCSSCPVFAIK